MRIVALVESAEHVCCRYRLSAYAAGLAAHGHSLSLQALPRGLARWRIGARLEHADLVILQRKLLPVWQLALLRKRVQRLAFDFDDAVFLRDSYHRKGPNSKSLQKRFAAMMHAADVVTAGNDWLADRASKAGANNVNMVPTCVEPAHYPIAKHDRTDGGLTLIWIGSASTLQGLERARPLLEHLGRSIPRLSLRLVCDAFLDFEHVRVEKVLWKPDCEAAQIAAGDVGISILPDDDWSRGKCGLKVIQYLAAGLPVVGNPVGVTPEIVDQDSGMMVNSPGDWVAAVNQLRSPVLRRSMGAAGRRRVETCYFVSVGVARWLRLLDDLALPARRAV